MYFFKISLTSKNMRFCFVVVVEYIKKRETTKDYVTKNVLNIYTSREWQKQGRLNTKQKVLVSQENIVVGPVDFLFIDSDLDGVRT
jgi:hypothetical protein